MSARECGNCRECCIVLAVEPMNKPENVACEHLCSKGCGIYESRPNACRIFTCGWLEGAMPKSMRPDKTHAVMWGSKLIGNGGQEFSILQCDMRVGQKWHPRVVKALLKFSYKIPAMIVQDRRAWLYHMGQKVCEWDQRNFIRVGFKRGRLVATVIPRDEVIKNDADEVAWEQRQVDSIEIEETEPEFAQGARRAIAERTT